MIAPEAWAWTADDLETPSCPLCGAAAPPGMWKAVTTSALSRLSQVSPYLRDSQPTPPPRVTPASPVLGCRSGVD